MMFLYITLLTVSEYFEILPYLIIGLGVSTFIVSAVGFITAGMESRPGLIAYALIMICLTLGIFGKFNMNFYKTLRFLISRNFSFRCCFCHDGSQICDYD